MMKIMVSCCSRQLGHQENSRRMIYICGNLYFPVIFCIGINIILLTLNVVII
ncbi:hypothetical protein HanRHA438_Chr10g0458171 [Helianthus annuus]|nr:hypothetical protein HanRHA438_Chr10g0458171 [Helianthus annuus]